MNKRPLIPYLSGILCSSLLLNAAPVLPISAEVSTGTVNIGEWTTTVNGNTTVLNNYIGHAKDVVIPLSGDLGTTNVKITKTALRAAATSADNQGGTLANSANDTAGTGLVADNSTDDDPSDTTVDYSGTFKDLTKITKIDLSQLKIEAHDGANGQDVTGADGTKDEDGVDTRGKDALGEDGQAGESIDVSSMFENCTALKEVELSSFVGQGGNGGNGGNAKGGNGYDYTGGVGASGKGGNGGVAGNFNAQNMFENTSQLVEIQLVNFVGQSGRGGNGGDGRGGNGGKEYQNYGGDGIGGLGYNGGTGYGGDGGDTKCAYIGGIGGNASGGRGYGGNGGDAHGGRGGTSTGMHDGLSGTGGDGGIGYGGHSYGGIGGDGYGGDGGTNETGFQSNGGDGIGGQSGIAGGDGHGGTPNGTGKAGAVNPLLLPKNLTGGNLQAYQDFTGTTNKTNMFSPIAVNELALTKKVGFTPDELKENVGALRRTDSGKGENIRDSELKNVSLSAKDKAGNDVDLAKVARTAGEYTLTYSYKNKEIATKLTVVEDKTTLTLSKTDLSTYEGTTYGEKQLRDNIATLTDSNGNNVLDTQKDKVTITAKDEKNNTVALGDLSKKVGTYTITYTYNGQVVEAHLTVAPAFYTVTFKADANGALQGQTSVRVAKDGKIITLPTPKPHKYYTFDGWYDKNNKKVDPKKVSIKDNTTFTAKFNRLIILKPLPVKHNASPFKDISKSIFKNHINFIYSRGITTGYTPTTYNPEGKVTRGEMAVFLYRLAGSPHYTPTSNPFKDITLYKNQILWMDYTTVTQGTRPYYNPNGNVTRGQMAAFLHRMAVIAGKTPENKKYVPPFTDAKKHMFANDIGWAKAQGITTGYTPTIFKPDASITRGEMAAFLQRFYNQFNK